MKKLLVLLITLTGLNYCSLAQEPLMVRSSAKGLYIEHKVTPKENFYSVGRKYNVHPKELAAYNKLDMSKGLNLGQLIRIPLSSVNFNQSKEVGIPVFYRTSEKEGLQKISQVNNNVPIELLRKWNKMENDNVKAGVPMIVGYLVLAPQELAVVKEEVPVAVEKSKEEVIVKTEPVKEEVKPVQKAVIAARETGQGYFKSLFDQQVKSSPAKKNQTVTAGIFKTSSGWNDAKYYLLMDAVQPGIVVKLINPTNNKVIYAKVLGEMSGIRQNEGYDIRISNAAASALKVTDEEKFIVSVNY